MNDPLPGRFVRFKVTATEGMPPRQVVVTGHSTRDSIVPNIDFHCLPADGGPPLHVEVKESADGTNWVQRSTGAAPRPATARRSKSTRVRNQRNHAAPPRHNGRNEP